MKTIKIQHALLIFAMLLFGLFSCKEYKGYKETYNKGGIVVLKNEDSIQAFAQRTIKKDKSAVAQTSYAKIMEYKQSLIERLAQDPLPLGLSKYKFPLSINMSLREEEIGRLLRELPDGDSLMAVFGIYKSEDGDDNKDQFTVSFLIRRGGDVHPRHITTGADEIKGEETWPAESITFYTDPPRKPITSSLQVKNLN